MTRSAFLARLLTALPFLGWVVPKLAEGEAIEPTEGIWPEPLNDPAPWYDVPAGAEVYDAEAAASIRTRVTYDGTEVVQEWSVLDGEARMMWRGKREPGFRALPPKEE